MKIILDIEADGLIDEVTTIHCVVVIPLNDSQSPPKTYYTKEEFLADLPYFTEIIFHNGLKYDLLVLEKIWGIDISVGPDYLKSQPVRYWDTFVMSSLFNPDRGGHSLEWWGEELGFRKTDFKDYKEYSIEMEAYCYNDCILTGKVFNRLIREIAA